MAPVLNESEASPGPAHKMFVRWRKLRIEAGTQLFKFTEHPLFTGGRISPWWAFVSGGPAGDPGLDGVVSAARRSGRPVGDFIRDWFAVMVEWNALSVTQSGLWRVQRVRLLEPVFGFYGPCQRVIGNRQPLAHPLQDQSAFAGGALQLYIPNLSGEHVMGVGLDLVS